MTFQLLERRKSVPTLSVCSTPSDSVRASSQLTRSYSDPLLVFWLGLNVASAIGLNERRTPVSLMVDDSGRTPLIAIKPDPCGEFYASQRLRAFAVYTNSETARQLLGGDGYCHDIIGPDELSMTDGMVAFPLRVRSANRIPRALTASAAQ